MKKYNDKTRNPMRKCKANTKKVAQLMEKRAERKKRIAERRLTKNQKKRLRKGLSVTYIQKKQRGGPKAHV